MDQNVHFSPETPHTKVFPGVWWQKNKINNSSTGCNTCQHPEIQKHPAEIDNKGRHV